MGTRGAVGFYIDGSSKIAYNHWDSYPSGLGNDVVKFLRRNKNLARLRARAVRWTAVSGEPTAEQIARCTKAGIVDMSVDSDAKRKGPNWYQLLRGAQGKLAKLLTVGFYESAGNFMLDSLFCEWAYVINLDEGVFEVYKGFNTKPGGAGRFCADLSNVARQEAEKGTSKWYAGREVYYPVRLVASFPLDAIPDGWEKIVDPPDEDMEARESQVVVL